VNNTVKKRGQYFGISAVDGCYSSTSVAGALASGTLCVLTLLCTEEEGVARCGEPAILCKPETSVGLENSILDVVVAVVSSSTAPVDVRGKGGGAITLTWISLGFATV
jgi:hypothetical protein